MSIYGLSTCSNYQKMQNALEIAGNKITFRDVHAEPLTKDKLEEWVEYADRTTNNYCALTLS